MCTHCKLFGHLTENCRSHITVNMPLNSEPSHAKGFTSSQVTKANSTWRIARRRGRGFDTPSSSSAPPASSNIFDVLSADMDASKSNPPTPDLEKEQGSNTVSSHGFTLQHASAHQSAQPSVSPTAASFDFTSAPQPDQAFGFHSAALPSQLDVGSNVDQAPTRSEAGESSEVTIPPLLITLAPSTPFDRGATSGSTANLESINSPSATHYTQLAAAAISDKPPTTCNQFHVSPCASPDSISPDLSSWASKIKSIDGSLLFRLSSADIPVLSEHSETSRQIDRNIKIGKQGMGRYKNSRSK